MTKRWAVCLLFALVAVNAFAAPPAPIRLGSVAMDVPIEMQRRLAPLTKYLSHVLRRPVVLVLAPNMPTAIRQLAKGQVDFSYLTPVAYINAHRTGGAQLVARTVTKGQASFRLMIVVRKDSPIRRVADLHGKDFAFGDKAAILQRAVVVGAGMPLSRLGHYDFIGHYDNIARGVMIGDFDAGILKDTSAYAWRNKGLRILYTSPPLPPYNISARRGLDPAIISRVRAALLALRPNNAADRSVLHALDPAYGGFAPVSDRDYDIVRKLIAPFRK